MDLRKLKLGKMPARSLVGIRSLRDLVIEGEVPEVCDWSLGHSSEWGMMRNDEIGCCTVASAAHMVQCWSHNVGSEVVLSDDVVEGFYSEVSGFSRGVPGSDTGAYMLDVLNAWRDRGLGGHGIFDFLSVDVDSSRLLRFGAWRFGGLHVGFMLPNAILGVGVGGVWDVPGCGLVDEGEPGSWGGHAMSVVSFDSSGVVVVTWGMLQRMTWEFFFAYCDEAFVVLSGDWIGPDGKSPSGFMLEQLRGDLGSPIEGGSDE